MDSSYISQRQVIERYVQGTLTPEELEAFEIYLLEHPETVDDIEYEQGLHVALVRAKGLLQPSASRSISSWLGPRYALAATVALVGIGIATFSTWRANVRLIQKMELLQAPIVLAEEIRLERMRGVAPLIVEKRSGERLLLSVAVEDSGSYEVSLRSTDGTFTWQQLSVEPGIDGTLRIAAGDLAFGRYELAVTPAGTTQTSNYAFELRSID